MFKLKKFDSEIDKQKAIEEIYSSLIHLPNFISEIKSFEVGVNTIESPRANDIVLISEFNSMEDLEVYAVHPEHLKVVEIIKKHNERVSVVDFEF